MYERALAITLVVSSCVIGQTGKHTDTHLERPDLNGFGREFGCAVALGMKLSGLVLAGCFACLDTIATWGARLTKVGLAVALGEKMTISGTRRSLSSSPGAQACATSASRPTTSAGCARRQAPRPSSRAHRKTESSLVACTAPCPLSPLKVGGWRRCMLCSCQKCDQAATQERVRHLRLHTPQRNARQWRTRELCQRSRSQGRRQRSTGQQRCWLMRPMAGPGFLRLHHRSRLRPRTCFMMIGQRSWRNWTDRFKACVTFLAIALLGQHFLVWSTCTVRLAVLWTKTSVQLGALKVCVILFSSCHSLSLWE
jgi:hypothetical protein